MDAEIENRSSTLHHFLAGQLSLGEERTEDALQHLREAEKGAGEEAPLLYSDLTKLYLKSGSLTEAQKAAQKALRSEKTKDNYLLAAGALELSGEIDMAIAVYNEAQSLNSLSSGGIVLYSAALLKADRAQDAVSVLQNAERTFSKDYQIHYYLGLVFELIQKHNEAAASLKKALALRGDNQRIQLDLIRILVNAKQIDHAQQVANELVQKYPANVIIKRIATELKQTDKNERKVLDAILEFVQNPMSAPSQVRLDVALNAIEQQEFEEAERELLLVLASEPGYSRARYYLASLYASTGRNRTAILELMRLNPGEEMFVESRTFASYLFKQLGDLEGAEQAVRDAIAARSDDDNLLMYLVDLLRESGKNKEARKVLEEAIDNKRDGDHILFALGVVLHDLGDDREAEASMEHVLKSNPDHAQALNYLAYSLAENGKDLDRAQKLIERALLVQPDDGFFLDTYGWIHFKAGRYDKAVEILSKAVNLTGDDATIMEHYADALMKIGKDERAFQFYNSALLKAKTGTDKDDRELIPRVEKKVAKLRERFPGTSALKDK